MSLRTIAAVAVAITTAVFAAACTEPVATDEAEQPATLDDYNHYPSDRQSYQLDTRGLLTPPRLAALEYVNRAFEDRFAGFTLQSFKTYPTFEYAFIFKARAASPGNRYRCVKIKAMVDLSPTDAYPRITRVKELPQVTGEELCRDGSEI